MPRDMMHTDVVTNISWLEVKHFGDEFMTLWLLLVVRCCVRAGAIFSLRDLPIDQHDVSFTHLKAIAAQLVTCGVLESIFSGDSNPARATYRHIGGKVRLNMHVGLPGEPRPPAWRR
jgi:hypothetical protein